MARSLHDRLLAHLTRVSAASHLARELRIEEIELLSEANAKGRLGPFARAYLVARGERVDAASLKRERDRLYKLLKRHTRACEKARDNPADPATPCRSESLAVHGRSASEDAKLEGMNHTPTQPRYRKTVTTEVVEHFLDPEESLDGLREEFDDDDEDFDEDAP